VLSISLLHLILFILRNDKSLVQAWEDLMCDTNGREHRKIIRRIEKANFATITVTYT